MFYTKQQREVAVARAQRIGIRPAAAEMRVTPDIIKEWMREAGVEIPEIKPIKRKGKKTMAKRNKYTDEQKAEILKRAAEIGVSAAAREYNINRVMLQGWKTKAVAADAAVATEIEAKKTVKRAGRKAKEAVETVAEDVKEAVEEVVVAEKVEAGKAKAKVTRKKAEAKAKVEEKVEKVKKTVRKPKAAAMKLVFQSQAGGEITPEDIAAKVPADTTEAYIKIEQNRIYYVMKDGETGSVEIWE